MEKEAHIKYWLTTAQHDIDSAFDIYKAGRYDWALFVGHLALEKVLKAHWVKNNEGNVPPKVHHLVRLSNEAGLQLSDEQIIFMGDVNTFNIEARYPEEKFAFHKLCTREFAEEKLEKIKELYQWLLQKI